MDHDELQRIASVERAAAKPVEIRCCTSSGCRASGSAEVLKQLRSAVQAKGLSDRVTAVGVGCPGLCSAGPVVSTHPDGAIFGKVTADHAEGIVSTLSGESTNAVRIDPNQPFFAKQFRIVRATAGQIDPERIESYIAADGYAGLYQALQQRPDEIVADVTASGLRGRGGAGYPTGLKWATVAKMPPGQKYVICNGDEGDPGAFMDRSVMEDAPHQVLEGMAIAAYAVGANQGYVYVRAEYPLAIERLQAAIHQATKAGLLGGNIFQTPFEFKVEIRIGAGAFVCGEETALIASVQGLRGTPRPRPPYPAESGLWDRPTLINNVETFATIPAILRNGSDWFAGIGTGTSKGTKIFSLTGKVKNAGLVEVPMGTTLREVVEQLGGGTADGRAVKAVQTGGPSGGCIPADLLDTPIDYESLGKIGSIMGSGGMIVMDDTDRMPEVARFFMEFCADESCGKCVPCRVGTVQLHGLLTKLVEKRATRHDLDLLIELCHLVKDTSLCGLGQSAPNPVMSTLRYFAGEYEALLQPEEFARPPRRSTIPLTVV
ncbi:MAG: SLBB domain-containing protein [Gemmataceae bacterium]|nr:SLBB domain-containing protein [Gemmataceae bacterium]